MDQPNVIKTVINQKPLFEPVNLNIDYVFGKIYIIVKFLYDIVTNPQTWTVIGTISALATIFFIGIIVFSLIRLFEIQNEEDHHIDHEIKEALEKMKQIQRVENPRWHYVLTLIESSNESDWRVAIIEADSMLEEILREKGYSGDAVSELLDSASESGYGSIANAWEAHHVRNQIAHDGVEYPLSQIEGRRVIRMYQNFFEELGLV